MGSQIQMDPPTLLFGDADRACRAATDCLLMRTLDRPRRDWRSALGNRRDAQLTADRPRYADANLAMPRHERLRPSGGMAPCLVAAPASTGEGLDSVRTQPALQLCALHWRIRSRGW